MTSKKKEAQIIYDEISNMFPNVKIELNYKQKHELLIAIMLSAQTTDISVNKVTKNLFSRYKSINDFATADIKDLESELKNLGLYRNKAKNLKKLSEMIINDFDNFIPKKQSELQKLPGVGRKTANVFLAEYYKIPRIAVDTHVSRVSIRLGLAQIGDSPKIVEDKLMKLYDETKWIDLHHKFIHFGRYFCKARNPKCKECPLLNICKMPDIK
ncbi:MAG: endonuclease III [Candidatus Izimaplasma sp.]|nr:endonuclease III [Candidatus Izimaplasma bacterium]